jgi:hypothetical protein
MQAQVNLVPNPSFEEHNNCPGIGFGYLDSSSTLYPTVKRWFSFSNNFPAYNNECATHPLFSIPFNASGYQNPNSGSAYLRLNLCSEDSLLGERRSYTTIKLLYPLGKDSIYKVSFWVSLGELPIGIARIQNLIATSSIGVYFSQEKQFYHTMFSIPVEPQVNNNTTRFLDDTIGWMEVSGLYKALGGEQYITIGNFNSRVNTPHKIIRYGYSDSISGVGNYYLDDVSVTAFGYVQNTLTDTILCEENYVTLHKRSGFDSCVWSDGDTTSNRILNQSGKYLDKQL